MTNTIEKKLTHIEILNAMLAVDDIQSNPIFKEYIENEITKLLRRKAEKAPTKTQEANAELKTAILSEMEAGILYTISDMIKNLPSCENLSNQKVSAVIRQMMLDDKTIVKTVEKRTSYFSKA